jgi:hypothetical protein
MQCMQPSYSLGGRSDLVVISTKVDHEFEDQPHLFIVTPQTLRPVRHWSAQRSACLLRGVCRLPRGPRRTSPHSPLTLAKDRLSIDRSGLMTRLGQVLTVDGDAGAGAAAAVRSALDGHLPAALEVILLRDGDCTMLVELPRFDENGDKCLQFQAGQVTLPSGEQREVVRRAASMSGMERMVSATLDLAGEHLLIVEPADFPGDDVPG